MALAYQSDRTDNVVLLRPRGTKPSISHRRQTILYDQAVNAPQLSPTLPNYEKIQAILDVFENTIHTVRMPEA